MKYFAIGNLINLSRVDQERKLDEILVKEVPTNQDAQKVATGSVIQLKMKEDEEEEGANPCSLS